MTPYLELIRLESKAKYGTFGFLKINGQVFCATLEPPAWENQESRSCIPAQQYDCVRTESPRHGETFRILDVPGRSDIMFHAGNRKADTSGCIILGEHFGKLRGDRAVLNSGRTFRAFMGVLQNVGRLSLTIKEVF